MCPWYFAQLQMVDGIYTSGEIAQFQGLLLAVWLKCIVVWRVSCPDLFLDNLPPKCVPAWYFALLHMVDGIHTSWEIAKFRGLLLAVWLKCIVLWRVSCPDLFLDNLPPKCVPSTLLCYTWKMAYTQVESLHNFTAIHLAFDSNV